MLVDADVNKYICIYWRRTVHCASCGENNFPGTDLCRRCGQKLVQPDQQTASTRTPASIPFTAEGSAAATPPARSFKRVSLRKQQTSTMKRVSAKIPTPAPAGSPPDGRPQERSEE